VDSEKNPIALVSVSGGKDSTATWLVALERLPKERIIPVFADTGNEHESTYEYIRYLGRRLGFSVKTVRADFTDWWWERRNYIRDVWPTKEDVPASLIERALKVFDKGPTGNPFLDLCLIKGRFPSRTAQFCTDFLKKQPLNRYLNEMVAEHGAVESWQGVRADESARRRNLPERETFADSGELFSIYRPILRWNVEMVFEQHRKHNVEPNPLYKLGMSRVGCMPCVNANKDDVLEISKRFPQHIERIAEWEELVGVVCRAGMATFFAPLKEGQINGIRDVVQWSKTARGGVNLDMFRGQESESCSSRYGLCE
jgi:3'-phosphoadenosine 5'-phosphosulfate sulfotransferase (PAPS reductase)/FAD synthetase